MMINDQRSDLISDHNKNRFQPPNIKFERANMHLLLDVELLEIKVHCIMMCLKE